MPRLYSSKYISSVLQKHGFIFVSQKGSHAKYHKTKRHETLVVIVPMGYREIPIGTFKSILRQSKLDIKDFRKNL